MPYGVLRSGGRNWRRGGCDSILVRKITVRSLITMGSHSGKGVVVIVACSELRYDSGGITRGRHARRLRYTTMSGRIDVI